LTKGKRERVEGKWGVLVNAEMKNEGKEITEKLGRMGK